jgi:hypothetical protein
MPPPVKNFSGNFKGAADFIARKDINIHFLIKVQQEMRMQTRRPPGKCLAPQKD